MLAATPSDKPPRWLAVLRNPLSRIVLYAVMAAAIGMALHWLLPATGRGTLAIVSIDPADPALWLYSVKSLVPVALAYWLLVRLIEGRRVEELAPRKLLPHYLVGWLVGTAILLLAAAAMALFGAYTIQGVNHGVNWLTPLLVLGLLPGITEEILLRGVLFRIIEDGLGSWIALIVSALVFGFLHMGNPNATLWSSLAIAVEAGLLLALAYAWTRSLWFVMGLHAAWNFAQGVLLGIPVSGIAMKGFLASSTQGSVWLSGGEFGAEASVSTVLICTALAGYFGRQAIVNKRLKPPFWRRRMPLMMAVGEGAESVDANRPEGSALHQQG